MADKVQAIGNGVAFEFVSRSYEAKSGVFTFTYRVHFDGDEPLECTETIKLQSADRANALPQDFIDALLEDLHLVLGISYYKLFLPPSFVSDIELSDEQAEFWNTVYQKGLGEFLYRNGLEGERVARFESTKGYQRRPTTLEIAPNKLLIGIGGGKDSIVSLELLEDFDKTGFVVETGHENIIAREVVEMAELPLRSVKRILDPKLVGGVAGSYEGHVPISAVYAFLGVLEAAIGGYGHVVVSNEQSSDFGNTDDEGNEVNHQWSKSSEFEQLFQTYVRRELTPNIRYFSLLRPFYELRIAKMFARYGEKYFGAFSSCNKNFAQHNVLSERKWCGECPKCAFSFLMLAAFLSPEVVRGIFKKDLFEDAALLPLYRDLIGLGDMKPFDCVGTFDESKVALSLAAKRWGDSLVVKEFLLQIGDVSGVKEEIFKAQKALTVPSTFRMCGMESVLILGYGREGQASEAYLKERYPEAVLGIADQSDGDDYLQKQEDVDIVIKTPGIPGSQVTRQYTTATDFFMSEVPREQVIGVTGSKGKSTTSTLIYEMLKSGGKKVRLVGNIGTTALQGVMEHTPENDELFVFELSSYQLADLDISPHVAVGTVLFPEHLDHHGALEPYFDAKRNIVRYQDEHDVFVYNGEVPQFASWAEDSLGSVFPAITELPFSVDNMSLRGTHNLSNVRLAYTVARMFGVEDKDAEKAVKEFIGLPHRLMYVGTKRGIDFYDDAISTTPESTIAALHAIPEVHTLILGGKDRGYDFSLLREELKRTNIRTVVLLPESGEHILPTDDGFTVLRTDSIPKAVEFALQHTSEGKVCLYSPASPSFTPFKSFEERGALFVKAVEQIDA